MIVRAQKILEAISTERSGKGGKVVPATTKATVEQKTACLFSSEELVLHEIKSLDLNNMTPLEAMHLLELWKRELKGT